MIRLRVGNFWKKFSEVTSCFDSTSRRILISLNYIYVSFTK